MIDPKDLEYIYQLKNLIRYNNKTRIKDETVAEHSFYVALISLLICNKYKLSQEIICKTLIKAILHDMPEIEINDITHDVKNKLNLSDFLKKYEDSYYEKYFPDFSNMMINDTNDISQAIVNLADAESVFQFIQHEKLIGNISDDINKIYFETIERLSSLEKKFNEKLKELKNEY